MKLILFLLSLLVGSDNPELSNFINPANKPTRIKLPNELIEISGIAFDDKGNLFCHNDEEGIIYLLDIKTGIIKDKIIPGNKLILGDFEDLCLSDDRFYLLRSDGKIISFTKTDFRNKFEIIETGLTEKNNCEGLYFDETTNSLLIACKNFAGKKMKRSRAIYSYSIKKNELERNPRFLISLDLLKNNFGINEFNPSAIAMNKESNTYFILSAKGNPSVLEISKTGKILAAVYLDKKLHPQPEGIAFYQGKMFISDEGVSAPAVISIYSKIKSTEK